jgi:hypothetical protein
MGLIASSLMIIFILPCYMMVLDDVKGVLYFLWNGRPRPAGPATASAA